MDSLSFVFLLITLSGTAAVFSPLSFSELVSKAVHLYGPPISNNSQSNIAQYQLFPCLNFTCRGRINKLWFVARRHSQFSDTQLPPSFHILRKYQGPEYCSDTDPPGSDCEYYQWLRLNWNMQQSLLIYGNDTVGVYETTLTANSTFERGDILGVFHPTNSSHQVLYQREGGLCDSLGDITIHLFSGHTQIQYPRQDPVLPYVAIETDVSSQRCAMGFLKKKSLRVIVDAPRDSGISNSFDFRLTNIQSMPINESGLLAKFFIAAKFDHTSPSGWPVLQIRRRIFTNDASYLSQPFSTTMEPRPTGYLNVFEYDVRNMAFDFQHSDLIRVFWPQDTNVISRRYSLAYFRDTSNVMLSIEIGQTASTTPDDSISTPVPQTTTSVIEITTTTKKPTPELKEGTTTMNNGITRSGGVLDMVTSSVISTQREQFGHVTATNNTIIIIGSLACTMLVLMLLTVVSVTTVLTYRWHKHKTATQQASSDFDMDSNQAYTTRKESKHDETVDMCIEMDANQAYVTHSKANIKGQQEQDQGATGTTECIEMDANQAYVTPSETNKGLQEQGQGATGTMEMDANQAYGTNTVLSDPSVTYDNNYPPQANDYDYIALS